MVGEDIVPTVLLLCLLLLPGLAHADEPTITVTLGNDTRTFTRGELLVRPDATTIDVARDVTYRVLMTYRAVPVASLLAGMTLPLRAWSRQLRSTGSSRNSRPASCSTPMRARLSLGLKSNLQSGPGHQFRKRT
jgi:hypothetical protein